ncbi:MAG: 50S ribosomal protein L22 [Clostridia bacterium]|jgi:large subunit ribosomal protein L22|nr:50S ribosomal protein L22 [Clostridia bacterium]
MATRIREKTKAREESKDTRPQAKAKYIRISANKVNATLALIRGKKYTEAVAILNNLNKSSSEPVLKALNSAAANAENNLNMNKDSLVVAKAVAEQGPTLKRFRARAKGRGARILKRTSHISVVLAEIQG